MTMARTMSAAIAVVGLSLPPLSSQQEIDPNLLCVCVQKPLFARPQPSPTSVADRSPTETVVTGAAVVPQNGAFVRVTTDGGQAGWALATAVRTPPGSAARAVCGRIG